MNMNAALKAAPGKILVIGQRNTFFSSLQAIAPTHWQLIQAPTLMRARQIMKSESIDLIMLMIDPLQVAISTVTELRLRASVAHLPIVIIDEKADVARQAESFAMGADAYFTLPIDSRYFPAAIDARLMLSQVMAESAPADQSMAPVTPPPVPAPTPPEQVSSIESREYFEENFLRLKSLVLRTRDPLSLAVIELDAPTLQLVPDARKRSEAVGKFLEIVRQTLRYTDVIFQEREGRYTALFALAGNKGSYTALTKIKDAWGQEKHYLPDGGPIPFYAAIVSIKQDSDLEEALERANALIEIGRREHKTLISEQSESGAKRQVLLVEDDATTSSIIEYRLTRDGFEVSPFYNGEDAHQASEGVNYDLIILSVKLPGMDGLELLSYLRKSPANRSTPVIFLTNVGQEQEVIKGFGSGADDYIQKPFSPTELMARIRQLIKE